MRRSNTRRQMWKLRKTWGVEKKQRLVRRICSCLALGNRRMKRQIPRGPPLCRSQLSHPEPPVSVGYHTHIHTLGLLWLWRQFSYWCIHVTLTSLVRVIPASECEILKIPTLGTCENSQMFIKMSLGSLKVMVRLRFDPWPAVMSSWWWVGRTWSQTQEAKICFLHLRKRNSEVQGSLRQQICFQIWGVRSLCSWISIALLYAIAWNQMRQKLLPLTSSVICISVG